MPTILICDDDEDIRELLGLHLSNAGYDVQVAEDALVAGDLVLKSLPDLLIVDIHMPYMDGFEFVAALSGDPTIPHVPVIFLTIDESGEERARELGAVGFVTKPVRADELLLAVEKALQDRGGRRP